MSSIAAYNYDARGQIIKVLFGNGSKVSYSYDSLGNRTSVIEDPSCCLDLPLSVAQGGTGGTTAASARSGIGAAASGANGDITSLSGLSTPLSTAQGGTGISADLFDLARSGLLRRKFYSAVAENATTNVRLTGASSAITTAGTASALNDQAENGMINYASAATTDALAGFMSWQNTQKRWSPIYFSKLKTGANSTDIQNVRIRAGFSSLGGSNPFLADVPLGRYAEFRYCPGTDGTAFWRCATKDSSGPTVTVTSVAVAANTIYEFLIDASPANGSIKFYLDGTLVATHTTDIISTTIGLNMFSGLATTAAAAKNIRLVMMGWTTN